MLNRLDRHIAWRYLVNIGALFAALFSFVVAIDVFLNLRRFVDTAEDLRPGASGLELVIVTLTLIVDLWGPRLLQLFNYVMGFVLVAAMGFTCANFVRHREFIAMLASGRSLHRLAWPIFVVAMIVTGAAAANQEFALPAVAHLLPRSPGDAGTRTLEAFRVPLVADGAGRLIYAAKYDDAAKVMEKVEVWERDAAGSVTRRIRADKATWDGARWALENGRIEPGARADARSGARESTPVATLETDLDPTAILVNQVSGYGQSLSWRQIDRLLKHKARLDEAGRERLERIRWGRVSMVVSTLLALVIAMPFFLVREPKNMVAQSLKCAPLALGALIGAALGAAAPLPGLPVWLGVFVPSIVLLPIAIWGAVSVKT